MAPNPWILYDLLLDALPPGDARIDELTLGLTWTLSRVGEGAGGGRDQGAASG